jgi:uncharacterized BrkB/YihY/UPF0761 family membrane protein
MAFYTETILADSQIISFFLGLGLVGMIISVLIIVFWLYMLIDCLRRDFKKDVDKLIWFLLLITTFFLGAVLYYFMIKTAKTKKRRR